MNCWHVWEDYLDYINWSGKICPPWVLPLPRQEIRHCVRGESNWSISKYVFIFFLLLTVDVTNCFKFLLPWIAINVELTRNCELQLALCALRCFCRVFYHCNMKWNEDTCFHTNHSDWWYRNGIICLSFIMEFLKLRIGNMNKESSSSLLWTKTLSILLTSLLRAPCCSIVIYDILNQLERS